MLEQTCRERQRPHPWPWKRNPEKGSPRDTCGSIVRGKSAFVQDSKSKEKAAPVSPEQEVKVRTAKHGGQSGGKKGWEETEGPDSVYVSETEGGERA